MTQFTLLSSLLLAHVLVSPITVGAEITDERAAQLAHKAFAGKEQLPPEWTFRLDKKLERWEWLKPRWQECSEKDRKLGREDICGAELAQMELALAGRRVWAVVYRSAPQVEELRLHPNAMVFVDADSAKVLAIITTEGAILFPK